LRGREPVIATEMMQGVDAAIVVSMLNLCAKRKGRPISLQWTEMPND
jgi:hypothetical protein